MAQPACGTDRINSFAAVSYIPGPLGDFLTRLRQELVTGCVARSHVSILPPRPLCASVLEAEKFFAGTVERCARFALEISGIRTFDTTLVIYLSIDSGRQQLHAMHDQLNTGPLYFREPYPYHPHITLAQGIPAEQFRDVQDMASRKWAEARLANQVVIDRATFVQNTTSNCWIDLLECTLLDSRDLGSLISNSE